MEQSIPKDLQTLQLQLQAQLKQTLDTRFPSDGVTVDTAYSGHSRALPMAKPMVAVGFARIAADPNGVQYLGEREGESLTLHPFQVVLAMEIAVPRGQDSGWISRIFQALADHLLLEPQPFTVTELECGPTAYLREMDCFTATAKAHLQVQLYTKHHDTQFTRFEVRRK